MSYTVKGGSGLGSTVGTLELEDDSVTLAKLGSDIGGEAFPAATSPAGADAWTDWDVSAQVPSGAKVAFVLCVLANNRSHGVRANGSAVERRFAPGVSQLWTFWQVQLPTDDSRILERYVATSAVDVTFRVVGWL